MLPQAHPLCAVHYDIFKRKNRLVINTQGTYNGGIQPCVGYFKVLVIGEFKSQTERLLTSFLK